MTRPTFQYASLIFALLLSSKGADMTRTLTPRIRRPARAPLRKLSDLQGSGSGEPKGDRTGSGSEGRSALDELLPKGKVIPVGLTLQFDAPLDRGDEHVRRQLNQSVSLIHAQDPAFACCWFSRAVDFGDAGDNPGYWMLEWTPANSWRLCLRRRGVELATYRLKAKIGRFPIRLKKGRSNNDFNWPASVTIRLGE